MEKSSKRRCPPGHLEIEAEVPNGALDNVVRIVTENCRTLKFDGHGFERE